MATGLVFAMALAGSAALGPPTPGDFAPSENLACRKNNPPDYPRKLSRAGIGGQALVMVTVDEEGSVQGVRIHESSGHPTLDVEAMRAVLRWCYWPGREGERTYGGDILVPIRFTP